MKWVIRYSNSANKFIKKENIQLVVNEALRKVLLKLIKTEEVNIDVKKLFGNWDGYYRIRKGKIRIIFKLETKDHVLYVDKIDFRGDVY